MRILRIILWVTLFVLLATVVTVGLVYWQASRAPEGYKPPALSEQQRKEAAQAFANGPLLGREGFVSSVNSGRPFTITATQEQLNAYLASMDEIAALSPKGRAGQVRAGMAKMGLADPMVELGNGRVRFMATATEYSKVLSVDVAVGLDAQNRLTLTIERAMIGRVGIPKQMVIEQLAKLRKAMASAKAPVQTQTVGVVTADELAKLMQLVVEAMEGEPVSLVYHNRVRVDSIEITDEQVSVHFVPLKPAAASAASK